MPQANPVQVPSVVHLLRGQRNRIAHKDNGGHGLGDAKDILRGVLGFTEVCNLYQTSNTCDINRLLHNYYKTRSMVHKGHCTALWKY